MRAGEIVEEGPSQRIFAAQRHDYTRLLLAAAPGGAKPPTRGQPPVLLTFGFVAAAWLWWRHWPGYAIVVLVVTLAGRGLAEVQKFTVERPRPMIVPHLVNEYTPPSRAAMRPVR